MENQIEEMAKHLCCDFGGCDNCTLSNPESETPCTVRDDCETLLKAGYRKASEVAREIVEDLENRLKNSSGRLIGLPVIIHRFIEDYKKKYTEEGK